jgi:DNA-binding transcriptional LysR family regulator
MPDLDTALLRTFVTLAETRSFARTGGRIGRSQPAVSAQLRRLEDMLGVRLIDRDTRNVRLTPEGERFLGDARALVAAADALLLRFRAPDLAGEVRFGSPEDFATAHLPAVLAAFAAAYPRVVLHVVCDLTLPLVAAFEAAEAEVIVVKQDPAAPFPAARPLWREPLVWAARPGFAPEGPVPLVAAPDPCVYRRRAVRVLDGLGRPWTAVFTSPSFAGLLSAVRAGLGLAVIPQTMLPPDLVPYTGLPAPDPAEIALLATPRPSPAAAALADFVARRLAR